VRVAAGEAAKNVLHVSRFPIASADRGRLLDPRLESEPGELPEDVVAHTIVIRRTHRMRPLRDLLDVAHRPLGGEHRIGTRRRNGARRPRNTEN